jgi:predicted transcriptional regulator
MKQEKFGLTDELREELRAVAEEETDGNASLIVRKALRDYFSRRKQNAEPDRLPALGDDRAPTTGG